MTPDQVAPLMRSLLVEALILSAPVLITGCLVSVALSLLQTLTSVQEQTLTAVPRLLVVFAAGVISLPWFLHRLIAYTLSLWSDFGRFVR